MRRRTFLATAGASVLGTAAVGSASATSEGLTNGSFENGLEGWTRGSDLPDPRLDWEIWPVEEVASDGELSAGLYLDGKMDDGTIWLQQQVDLSEFDQVKLDAYSPQKSFNDIYQIAVYTGQPRFLVEQDFTVEDTFEKHEGWKTFSYPVDYDGEGLVAVGANVIWEHSTAERAIDNVRLE